MVMAFFMIFRFFGFAGAYVDKASFQHLQHYRKALSGGNSAIHVDADVSSPGKALAYLPIGVAYFLFAPFPWKIAGSRQLYALPEILVWYCLFVFFIKGIKYVFKNKFEDFAPSITSIFLITVTYSLVEGNLGTAYRHRAQIMGFYLLFTGIGLARYLYGHEIETEEKTPQKLLKQSPQPEF